MTNTQIAIDITANDQTRRGIGSAERRLDRLGREAGKIGDRGLGKFVRSFAEIEEAAAGAFGGKSVLGDLGKRASSLSKIGTTMRSSFARTSGSISRVSAAGAEAASSLGATAAAAGAAEAGMGEAAAAAGGLAAAMGPVAVVGAGAVAVLATAAAAGYKFASGWAASTAQMGRLAETIGVASKNLQELQGAAERYGIGKDASSSAVGSFAQTVHDARYGRNNAARALLARLGVGFKTGADGNLDYNAMLADTADALKRQKDPQTALMVANQLGVGALLPMLRRGGGNLRSEQADVDRHGVVNSDADVANAQKFTRDGVMMGQMTDRAKQRTQAGVADKYVPALDAGVDLGRSALDGKLGASASRIGDAIAQAFAGRAEARNFVTKTSSAADKQDRAGDKMLSAAARLSQAALGPGAIRSGKSYGAFEDAIRYRGERSKDGQTSPMGARGYMQVMPKTAHHPGMGIRPVRDESLAEYNRVGKEYADKLLDRYDGNWALASAAYNAGPGAVDHWIKANGDPRRGQITDRQWIAKIPDGRHSGPEARHYAERVTDSVPVHVTVELKNAPSGTRATVTAGKAKAPAISHAMQH